MELLKISFLKSTHATFENLIFGIGVWNFQKSQIQNRITHSLENLKFGIVVHVLWEISNLKSGYTYFQKSQILNPLGASSENLNFGI